MAKGNLGSPPLRWCTSDGEHANCFTCSNRLFGLQSETTCFLVGGPLSTTTVVVTRLLVSRISKWSSWLDTNRTYQLTKTPVRAALGSRVRSSQSGKEQAFLYPAHKNCDTEYIYASGVGSCKRIQQDRWRTLQISSCDARATAHCEPAWCIPALLFERRASSSHLESCIELGSPVRHDLACPPQGYQQFANGSKQLRRIFLSSAGSSCQSTIL